VGFFELDLEANLSQHFQRKQERVYVLHALLTFLGVLRLKQPLDDSFNHLSN